MRPLRKSNSAPGRFAAILLLLVFALDCAPLWAQQTQPNVTSGFDGQPVSRVDIAARPDVNLDELRRLIKQEAGKPFSTEAMHESVAALQDTKLFTQVQVSLEPEQDGLRVLFILQPADYIGMIDFQGTGTRFPYTELLQAVNIPEQSPYVPDLAAQGQKGLLDYLHARGFFAAEVESEAHRDGNHRIVNLIFRCQLKRQAKIRTIAFNGLTPQQSADVQAALRGLWPKLRRVSLKPGLNYSEPRIKKSIQYVRKHLRKQDQLAPAIRLNPPQYDAASNSVDVTFAVTPGPKVSVRVAGAKVSRRNLQKLIPIYEEDAVDQDLVDEGESNLKAYFQKKGYFDATADSRIDKQADLVSVVYEVSLGAKHEVKGVYFEGNQNISDRELKSHVYVKKAFLFSHGTYSDQLVKKSADALTQLYKDQGFQGVSVEPKVEDFKPEVDVTFVIKEGVQDRVASMQITGNKTQSEAALSEETCTAPAAWPDFFTKAARGGPQPAARGLSRSRISECQRALRSQPRSG